MDADSDQLAHGRALVFKLHVRRAEDVARCRLVTDLDGEDHGSDSTECERSGAAAESATDERTALLIIANDPRLLRSSELHPSASRPADNARATRYPDYFDFTVRRDRVTPELGDARLRAR
jgi:hypothetical protein